MAIYLFIVAILNLALGYALALLVSRMRSGDAHSAKTAAAVAEESPGAHSAPPAESIGSALLVADSPAGDQCRRGPAEISRSPAEAVEGPVSGVSNLTSRAALERALAEWWRKDPDHARTATVGMIEVDQLRQITTRFGSGTSNLVLEKLTEIVAVVTRSGDLVSRSAGPRLLLLFPDTPASSSTSALERVRQTIAATQFLKGPEVLEVSVTCAIAERTAGDTPESLLARAEATLLDARQYGGNRTFLHEGRFPAPVTPHPFSPEACACTL